MAEKKSNNLTDKADPTISSDSVATGYPEGTHPVRPASEVTHSAVNLEYRDMTDEEKPDPTTVAQVQVLQGTEAGSFGRSDS